MSLQGCEILGTRPLHKVVPDLDHLLASPAAFLSRRSISIGRQRVQIFALLFALFLVAITMITMCAIPRERFGSWGWAFGSVTPLVIVGLIYRAWPVHCQLVLSKAGVELHYRKKVVWCPWSLFNTPGKALVVKDGLDYNMVLPVVAAVRPFLELRQEGKIIAQGKTIKARQLCFVGDDQVELPAVYEAFPHELGDLLLQLGRKMGQAEPKLEPSLAGFQEPPLETNITAAVPIPGQITMNPLLRAETTASASEKLPAQDSLTPRLATVNKQGWISLPLTRIQFPPYCCCCCRWATHYRECCNVFTVNSPFPITTSQQLHIMLPWCETCLRDQKRGYVDRGIRHMAVGSIAGILVSFLFSGGFAIVVTFAFSLIGLYIGFVRGHPEPYRAKYIAATHQVAFLFHNGQFREKVLQQQVSGEDAE